MLKALKGNTGRFGKIVKWLALLFCLLVSAKATAATVAEFYNTNLDNYFITADANEAAAIDGGSAGTGWSRTGNSFNSGGSTPVCRFYGSQSPGPNSHFYTAEAGECDSLKQLQATTPATEKRWNFESLDFMTTVPTNGACATGTTPIYRAYNNGWSRGVDSNHRITTSLTAIQQVVARGWNNEGVVMCAPSTATAPPTATGSLPDTGITASQCYQAGSDVLVACNSAGALALNSQQDGMTGRDANSATNGNTDGKLGFSYSAVSGGCVLDNLTGLMWEVKTNDGGLRDRNKTYSNYSATYNPNGLYGYGYGAATDASGYVAAVNAVSLCGHSDWRLPTADELQGIVDYGVAYPDPTLDAAWFPNTQSNWFWSSSPGAGGSNVAWNVSVAWSVSFGVGYVGDGSGRSGGYYVRLVRAGQPPIMPRYSYSADEQEVTDNETKLVWRRCAEGQSWDGASCAWWPSEFTHEAALQRAAAQAGSTGVAWRLPNIKELASIADRSRISPAIDTTFFPATPSYLFWSSSPNAGNSVNAWGVDFYDGSVGYDGGRGSSYYVRLVRAGQ